MPSTPGVLATPWVPPDHLRTPHPAPQSSPSTSWTHSTPSSVHPAPPGAPPAPSNPILCCTLTPILISQHPGDPVPPSPGLLRGGGLQHVSPFEQLQGHLGRFVLRRLLAGPLPWGRHRLSEGWGGCLGPPQTPHRPRAVLTAATAQGSGSWGIPLPLPQQQGARRSPSVPGIGVLGDPSPGPTFWDPRGSPGIEVPSDPPPGPTYRGPRESLSVPSMGVPGDTPPDPAFYRS